MAKDPEAIEHLLIICNGSDCKKKGAKEIGKAARKTLKQLGVRKQTMVMRTKCSGLCKKAPVVALQPENLWLTKTTPKEVSEVLTASLSKK